VGRIGGRSPEGGGYEKCWPKKFFLRSEAKKSDMATFGGKALNVLVKIGKGFCKCL